MIRVKAHRRKLRNGRYILVREHRRIVQRGVSPRVDSLDALYDYANGDTTHINYGLRRGSSTAEELKIADKLSRLETPMELPTLYRATLWKDISADFGVTRKNISSMVGKDIADKGYMSTSKDSRVPKMMYPIDKNTVFLNIKSKGKHRAIDVNGLLGKKSPASYQKEVLLGRNTRLTITGVKEKDGITYIDVELKS